MSPRFPRLIFFVVSGLFALGGCSSHRQLATQAVDFNLTVEKAQNEMLLLNVLRAKDRLPMYMTGISSLSGNVQTSLSTGIGGSYTRSKGRVPSVLDTLTRGVTSSAGASISANPSFSLAVLDTQEFMQGFLAPVRKETLAYYWNQGWPKDLLLFLLVQRVEIHSAKGETTVIRNYPDSEDPELREVKRFACWLRGFLARNPRLEEASVPPQDIGPPLSREEVSDVAKLVEISKAGLLINKVGDKDLYQLQRVRTDLRFTQDPKPSNTQGTGCDESNTNPSATPAADASTDDATRQQQLNDKVLPEGNVGVTQTDSTTLTFVLRSPEGLVYYLGELMRFANRQESPKVPYLCIQGRLQPIFVALPAGRCPDTLVDADAGRGGFSVPQASPSGTTGPCEEGEIRLEDVKCEAGRSMQALRLLSQLMSLQKSAKDAPSTAVVRVLN